MATQHRGSVTLVLGCMFSGKTSELFRRIRRSVAAKQTCLLIKYSNDVRYTSEAQVVSHNQDSISHCATYVTDHLMNNVELQAQVKLCTVIGIDEGQFFPDIATFADAVANAGKIVIIAALDGTFSRQPFGNILNVIPIAEDVIKLNAVCKRCLSESAAFTARLSTETQVQLIGGEEKYESLCRQCYHSFSSKKREHIEPCGHIIM